MSSIYYIFWFVGFILATVNNVSFGFNRVSENSKFFNQWANFKSTTESTIIKKTTAKTANNNNTLSIFGQPYLLAAGTLLEFQPKLTLPVIPDSAKVVNSKMELKYPVKIKLDELEKALFSPHSEVQLIQYGFGRIKRSLESGSTFYTGSERIMRESCYRSAKQRVAFFTQVEQFLGNLPSNYFSEKRPSSCVLRILCEMNQFPKFARTLGLFGDVVLTIASTASHCVLDDKYKQLLGKYYQAEKLGKLRKCEKYRNQC